MLQASGCGGLGRSRRRRGGAERRRVVPHDDILHGGVGAIVREKVVGDRLLDVLGKPIALNEHVTVSQAPCTSMGSQEPEDESERAKESHVHIPIPFPPLIRLRRKVRNRLAFAVPSWPEIPREAKSWAIG